MPYPSLAQLRTLLWSILSAVPPAPPLLSVWMPLAEFLMTLFSKTVPCDQLAEMASLASVTVLFVKEPDPIELNIAMARLGLPSTLVTLSCEKVNVSPLLAPTASIPRRKMSCTVTFVTVRCANVPTGKSSMMPFRALIDAPLTVIPLSASAGLAPSSFMFSIVTLFAATSMMLLADPPQREPEHPFGLGLETAGYTIVLWPAPL